jgi:hypothetical protein
MPSYRVQLCRPNVSSLKRSSVIVDAKNVPLADQTPRAGERLILTVQIPPLPSHSQTSYENITNVFNAPTYRVSWKQTMYPDFLLGAERWSAVSEQGGKAVYESREVIHVTSFQC